MKRFKKIFRFLAISSILVLLVSAKTADVDPKDHTGSVLVYVFDIKQDIGPAAWRITKKSFAEAKKLQADYIIIRMNTYGGQVVAADSIRTIILNSKIPVFVFIDNNAASAGALISIACDSIYMRKGANIGAATVVNQTGEAMPDKYQSYMRATMRATAEAHGKDTIIKGTDTSYIWHRNPNIAEAMVDQRIALPGITDSGKVLTLTAEEAIKHGFCEGYAENIQKIIANAGIDDYEIREFKPTGLEKIVGFLINPALQGILIMIIVGGIYFELQTPGVGFPLLAAGIAAILYFAPLYLEGLAENWEIIIAIVGIILILLELFVIPGFGIAGIAGLICFITGLALSMVDNIVFNFEFGGFGIIVRAFFIAAISVVMSLALSLYLGGKILTSPNFRKLVLADVQDKNKGYIGVTSEFNTLIGQKGIAKTDLRPSGKIEINEEQYDARAEYGYIEKGQQIKITAYSSGQLVVLKDT